MSRFSRVLHHIDMNDVKRRHQEKIVAAKLEEQRIQEEKEYIASVVEKEKSDWKKELEESQWTPVQSSRPTNSTSQTFQHLSGQEITLGGLGGSDVLPKQVTIMGELVDAPTYSQVPLAGLPMPVAAADPMARRNNAKKARETNAQLRASKDATQRASGASEFMNARVVDEKGTGVMATPESLKNYEEDMKIYHVEKQKAYDEWTVDNNKWYDDRQKDTDARLAELKNVAKNAGWKGSLENKDKGALGNYQLTKGKGKLSPDKLVVINTNNLFNYGDINNREGYTVHTIESAPIYRWNEKTQKNVLIGYERIKISKPKPGTEAFKNKYAWVASGAVSVGSEGVRELKDIPQPIERAVEKPLKPATVNLKANIPKGRGQGNKPILGNPNRNQGTPDHINQAIAKLPAKFQAPAKLFLGYLNGMLPKTIDNSFFGEKAAQAGFYGTWVDGNTIRSTGDSMGMSNVLGTTQTKNLKVRMDRNTGEFIVDMGFEYDFKPNHTEWISMVKDGRFKNAGDAISGFLDKFLPGGVSPFGKEAITAANSVFSMIGDIAIGGWYGADSKLIGAGWAIMLAKLAGNAKPTSGKISMNINDLDPDQMDPTLHQRIMDLFHDEMWKMEGGPGPRPDSTTWKGSTPTQSSPIIGGLPPASPASKKVEKKKEGRLDAYGGVDKLFDKKKKVNESTFETVKQLRKMWEYEGKPSPNGFPDNPPPKLKNGWHPEYGNKDAAYNRLDPESAKAMPETGNPKIDKKVKKAKKQPK